MLQILSPLTERIKTPYREMLPQALLIPLTATEAGRIKAGIKQDHLTEPVLEVRGVPLEASRTTAGQVVGVREAAKAPVVMAAPAEDQEGQKAQTAEVPKESNKSKVTY